MRTAGKKGDSDATSVLFTSALNYKIDLDRFLDSATIVEVRKDEHLDLGCSVDQGYFYYYVISGVVDMTVDSSVCDGSKTRLYIRGKGNVFTGEMDGPIPQSITHCRAWAVVDTRLAAFTYAQFAHMVKTDDKFLHDYLYMAQLSCDQMIQRIDNVYEKSGSRRMLLWLIKLCEVSRPDSEDTYRILCPLSIEELSSLLDVHYATCVKLLRSLKQRGIMERTSDELIVRDFDGLAALFGEENPVLY